MFVLPFIEISVIACIVAYIFKQTFAKVLPASLFLIVVLMYFSGIIGDLRIGVYAISAISLIATIYFIVKIAKKDVDMKIRIKEIIASPGFVIFIILYFAIFIYNINASFSFWDEWSHWSAYVKDMYIRNKFYNTAGHIATTHVSYPPFIQLFELFYCKLVGECNMQNMYRPYQILCYSLGIMAFSDLQFNKYEFKNNIKIVFVMILSILYFVFVNRIIDFQSNPIKSIYGDAFLGLSFGFFIINVIQYDFDDKFKTFNLILSSVALIFSKQMGTALFLLGFFILFIIVVYNRKLCKKVWIKGIILFIIPVLFFVSWKIIVFSNQITDQFDLNTKLSVTGLIDILFKGGGEDWQRTVITNYINWVTHTRMLGLTIYMWWILLAIAFIITSLIVKNRYKNKVVIASIGVMVGFILYMFSLLCLYFYTFGTYESVRLASIWRYSSTYIIGLTFILGFLLVEYLLYTMKMSTLGITLLLLTVCGIYSTIHFANEVNYMPKTIEGSDDYIYKKDFDYMKDLPAGAKVLIVSQGDQGLLGSKFRFKYFDKIFSSGSFGIPDYHNDDVWTQNKSKEEMREYVKSFDYIYFEKTDDNFKSCYNDIFKFIPENRDGIYSVNEILK